ncbi:hypothetical protein DFH09DRAFT_1495769 [Mycena vulgaris]|nr:hypothetical protein DFH09DRAFT_1495769 [Mycena vulgaris]
MAGRLCSYYIVVAVAATISVPLHVNIVNTVPHVSWSILTTANGDFTSEVLTNGGLLPMSTSQPKFRTTLLAVVPGDSPTFVTTQFPPNSPSSYCIMPNPVLGSASAQASGVNGRNDLFALCPNSTNAGRPDVVFDPIANHLHYLLANCNSVYIILTNF